MMGLSDAFMFYKTPVRRPLFHHLLIVEIVAVKKKDNGPAITRMRSEKTFIRHGLLVKRPVQPFMASAFGQMKRRYSVFYFPSTSFVDGDLLEYFYASDSYLWYCRLCGTVKVSPVSGQRMTSDLSGENLLCKLPKRKTGRLTNWLTA